MDRIFQIFFPFTAAIHMFTVRIRSKDLMVFLHEWSAFTTKFRKAFDPYYQMQLKSLKTFSRVLVWVYSSVAVVLFVSRSGSRTFLTTENVWLNLFLTNFFSGFMFFANSLVTLFTLLSLQTIWALFNEVGNNNGNDNRSPIIVFY
jgi:hypothetical protein